MRQARSSGDSRARVTRKEAPGIRSGFACNNENLAIIAVQARTRAAGTV